MARRTRNKTVVGLEIEPGAITAARVSVNGRIAVEQVATAPLAPHVVRDGEVADVEALSEALRVLWAGHKGLGKQVRLGVANARIVVRVMDLPVLEDASQLGTVVRFHAEQELPMPLDSAVLDFQTIGEVEGPDGPRTRVVVVAARRDMIERALAAVRAAGLQVVGIDLSAFAMLRALGGDEHPTLFLSVGGLTNLAVGDGSGGCTFTRVSGGGLDQMVVGLAERLQVPLDEARGWLERVGLEAPLSDFAEDGESAAATRTVLAAGCRQVAGEARSSLEFHQAQGGGAPVERIVLTGAGALLPGFAEALGEELGLPVEIRSVVEARPGVLGDVDPVCASVAAGLAVEEVPA